MTEAQIVFGIMQNDSRAWQYICRNMISGFSSIIIKSFPLDQSVRNEIDDLFQESCIILMEKVKKGGLVVAREGAVFSYLVQIGKLLACNLIRKKRVLSPEEMITTSLNLHKEENEDDIFTPLDVKQQTQNEFLDRVFNSIPEDCQKLLKKFYWDRKPMDEIACMLGLRNADSAKTKKNRCMNKFIEIGKMLVNNEEYAEDMVRDAVERAALRELLEDECAMMNNASIRMAALDIDDEDQQEEK